MEEVEQSDSISIEQLAEGLLNLFHVTLYDSDFHQNYRRIHRDTLCSPTN